MRKLLVVVMLLPLFMWGQEEKGPLMHIMEFTIKEGHQKDFMSGLKDWKSCYLENGGEESWSVWSRMMGDGSVVSITFWSDNWAQLDEEDDPKISENCDPLVYDQLMPHVEKLNRMITRMKPGWSNSEPGDGPIVVANFFEVDDYGSFEEVVSEVTETLRDENGNPRGTWFSVMSGKEGPDYFVTERYDNFAGLDADRDGVWKTYADAHGESKMKEMREKFRNALGDGYMNMYRLNKELSHIQE